LENISYIETSYENSFKSISYEVALQYAKQNHKNAKDAKISGFSLGVNFDELGLGLTYAYNKSKDNTASNGFGGGPFFTSCEHLTLKEAGRDGKVNLYGFSYEFEKVGLDGVTFEFHKSNLTANNGKKADDEDYVLSYQESENLTFDLIYSDVDDKINGEKFKNTRFFVNYSF